MPADGAKYLNDRFGRNLRQIAQLIKANVGLQVAFAERSRGWDTHANQGNADGTLATRLRFLRPGTGRAASGSRGPDERRGGGDAKRIWPHGEAKWQSRHDHGHGTCFFVMGRADQGWQDLCATGRALAPDKLFQNRDLAVTTDYRDVFAEVALKHLRVPARKRCLGGFQSMRLIPAVSGIFTRRRWQAHHPFFSHGSAGASPSQPSRCLLLQTGRQGDHPFI